MTRLKSNFDLEDARLINFLNLDIKQKEAVRTWRNKKAIRRWMYSDGIISKEEHNRFIKYLKNNEKNFYWLVKDRNDQDLGVVYLNRLDFRNKNAYLGIYAKPSARSQGSGSTLIKSLKTLAFDVMKLHTLKLEVNGDNERAIKFYKKHGFRQEARIKEFVLRNGSWKDILVMGIMKSGNR